MDEWLSYKPSGEYTFERVGDYGENYCTFISASLLDIKMDVELAALLSNAHRLLGQLEAISHFMVELC